MSKVDRFWSEEASNIRCVREADYDALSALSADQAAAVTIMAKHCKKLETERDALLAERDRLLDALEYALPYLEACIPNPRNGVNHDGSVDLNAVQRARDAIASCRAALQGEQP